MKWSGRFKIFCSIVLVTVVLADEGFTDQQLALKDVFKNDFLIGAAINDNQVSGKDANEVSIIESQFNSITPENCMKWSVVHPKPNGI